MLCDLVDIADDDELYRPVAPVHLKFDGTFSSSAFKTGRNWDRQISADLATLTTPECRHHVYLALFLQRYLALHRGSEREVQRK
jgi:hypothetical protein